VSQYLKKSLWVLLFLIAVVGLRFVFSSRALFETSAEKEWRLSPYPNGYNFAFTIIHDADSAYSRRLAPLFEVFDELGLKITVTVFTFWADWANNGDIWREWNKPEGVDHEFFAPKAVPLVDEQEREFYKQLAASGHEIGMHTPSDTPDTRQDLIRAFAYFKQVFGYYPTVYVEHAAGTNKEAQANEGSNPQSVYYNTDLLNQYGSWVWVDGPGALPDKTYRQFYDILAVNGSPFSKFAADHYGIAKGFVRTGGWKEADGEGFLQWYSEENIDSLERNRGLALVYTHLDSQWLDSGTKKMRESIKNRLQYLASKDGWFVPAGKILDRMQAVNGLELSTDDALIKIINTGHQRLDGLTIIARNPRSLCTINEVLKPNQQGEVVVGTIEPGEMLTFKICP
jgi:hypothetical protein